MKYVEHVNLVRHTLSFLDHGLQTEQIYESLVYYKETNAPTPDELKDAQKEQFGNFKELFERNSSCILSDDGLHAVLQKDEINVPTSLQSKIIDQCN